MLQEDETKALGVEPEEEVENDEAHPEDEDNSSEEAFGFGFTKKSLRKPKERQTRAAPTRPAPADTPAEMERTSNAAFKTKVSKAQDLAEVLTRFAPQALWQGSQKEKDVEIKLKKALELCDQLKSDPAADDASKKVVEQLDELCLNISATIELLSMFRKRIEAIQPSGSADLWKVGQGTMEQFSKLPQDCITAVLTQVGRSLSEVGFISFVHRLLYIILSLDQQIN